jgi:predicted HTH domain antitoxin
MIQIQLNLPESAFSALRSTPDEFGRELLIAAVVKWYEVGMISQSKAAEIAGISRQEFLAALNRFEVSPFQTTPEELEEELCFVEGARTGW